MGSYLSGILADRGAKVDVTTRRGRLSHNENVKYICGNARDTAFVRRIITAGYDVIVDFMCYDHEDEFRKRNELLTGSTGHYMFLSSSRVYADSETPITETSPRLLDVSPDKKYLATDEYSLTKAREEDILTGGRAPNWTTGCTTESSTTAKYAELSLSSGRYR